MIRKGTHPIEPESVAYSLPSLSLNIPSPHFVLKTANKKLPEFPRNIAGLEDYSENWNFETAAHLLRRTCFGPKISEINQKLHFFFDLKHSF